MKKLIAFLLCFTALAVGVTYGMIRVEQNKQQPKPEPAPVEQGIDLNGRYDQNDLLFADVVEYVGDAKVTYPSIDGLKDTEVENAVNAMIAAEAEKLKQSYVEQGAQISYLSYTVYGNFSNVLSIGLFSADTNHSSRRAYVNVNLNDGSEVKLTELFCSHADLHSLVRTAFYEALTRSNLSEQYWETVSSPDENKLYKVVKAYLHAEEQCFTVSPTEIILYYDDVVASLPMKDHPEEIAVYHRFLSEEHLFERSDLGYKGIFTCAQITDGYVRRAFGMAGDNVWYDVALGELYFDDSIPEDVQEQVNAYGDRVFHQLMDEVQMLEETARANPDRTYILLAGPYVSLFSDSEWEGDVCKVIPSKAVTVNENIRIYETSKQLFAEKYWDAMVAEYRNNPYYLFYGGIDEAIDGDEVSVTKRTDDRLFRYDTGEALTVDTLFVAGYDHASAVRAQAKYDLMGYHGYTGEEAELLAASAQYQLGATGLEIYVPARPYDHHLWIPLTDFNRNVLTIFQ